MNINYSHVSLCPTEQNGSGKYRGACSQRPLKVKNLYCADNGRPAIDPVVLFKMLFIGYLFGIRSEQRLVREVEVNVAYSWFLRFTLTDKIPHASTFSQDRRRRFNESGVRDISVFIAILYHFIFLMQ